ncbi:hypothetical protein [Bdellovibrio sp. HCB-162]|uniref:hypothetical protein n=1 Tax=Bdellovibrio sp. HCB-162 TaxID=3394234 RepID=UPI0039BD3B01
MRKVVLAVFMTVVVAFPASAQIISLGFWNAVSKGLSLLAGQIGGSGNLDGTGTAARFYFPNGLTIDSAGNIYLVDQSNNIIRKITPSGVVTTFAGTPGTSGSTDGTGTAAKFSAPTGAAIDASGNIYVAEQSNRIIRKITPSGVVTTFAGTAGASGSADGTGAAAQFGSPKGLAVDSLGNIYLADASNYTIRKMTSAGVVTTLAGTAGASGNTDGTGAAARFFNPTGLAVDSSNNVYVTDSNNHTIRRITPAGVVTTFAGTAGVSGSADGTGSAARFYYPTGLAIDPSDNIYVADGNHTIRKVTSSGVVTTLAGTAGASGRVDGTGAAARFNGPLGLTLDSSGNIYVSDSNNNTLRKITPSGVVTTFAGAAQIIGSADGSGAAATFNNPYGLTIDSSGNIYATDAVNYTIRKITPAGVVTTIAGTVGVSGTTDGTGAAAKFKSPLGIAVDSLGNFFVTDGHGVRKVTPSGVVTTFAGALGVSGSVDGTGTAARFYNPRSLTIDSADNIYVADSYNYTIRKITPAGVVTTFAGTAGASGSIDGTGASARLKFPGAMTIDSSGNIYIADEGGAIRKVTLAGVVTTLAGTAGLYGCTDGVGAAARFSSPSGLTTDAAGNIYATDQSCHTIRKITASGVVTTIVGVPSKAGVLLGALPGALHTPNGVVVRGSQLYISEGKTSAILTCPLP